MYNNESEFDSNLFDIDEEHKLKLLALYAEIKSIEERLTEKNNLNNKGEIK